MENSQSLHRLCEKSPLKTNKLQRVLEITISSLFICLLVYRLFSLRDHGFVWLLAFVCESCFAFNWLLILIIQWTPVEYKTYPYNLLQRVRELPPVDMFVATTDANLEPPIITVNTVLSLLAVDYPAHKLACYVSDDGCSPLQLYSLIEASKFAQIWVPFCKKYQVQVRAPFRYFSGNSKVPNDSPMGFLQEWTKMKDEYGKLCQKIEEAAQYLPPFDFSGYYADFAHTDSSNHATIIKVICENKQKNYNGFPQLVYVAREKRPNQPHHFKAGAMNVLVRVSGVMTNAPFMLNVDCDMYANNSQVVLEAICLMLGFKHEKEGAFVQFPQMFYDISKDDPLGNGMVAVNKVIWPGFAGIQGPLYAGTGCFHRRKVMYGLSLTNNELGTSRDKALMKKECFGNSEEFITSARKILSVKYVDHYGRVDSSNAIEAACQVSSSEYEHNTLWGTKVGWVYGSITEDVLTGMKIHAKGWKSIYCMPEPPAFMGAAPTIAHVVFNQRKRWGTGLLEIFFSKNNPIFATLHAKLEFRQCLAYTWVLIWGLHSIPELCYAVLPAYCIVANSNFLPKVREPALIIFAAVFLFRNLYTLHFYYLQFGLSIKTWWNHARMGPWSKIAHLTSSLFAVVTVVLKLLGLSNVTFEVTRKDDGQSSSGEDHQYDSDDGGLTFDESPIFVPATTLLFVHLVALIMGLLGRQQPARGGHAAGLGEVICSAWVVLCFWPFFKGLFRKGKYGIPLSTVLKSAALALLLTQHFGRISLPLP